MSLPEPVKRGWKWYFYKSNCRKIPTYFPSLHDYFSGLKSLEPLPAPILYLRHWIALKPRTRIFRIYSAMPVNFGWHERNLLGVFFFGGAAAHFRLTQVDVKVHLSRSCTVCTLLHRVKAGGGEDREEVYTDRKRKENNDFLRMSCTKKHNDNFYKKSQLEALNH